MFQLLKKIIISLKDMIDLNKEITKEIDAEIVNDLRKSQKDKSYCDDICDCMSQKIVEEIDEELKKSANVSSQGLMDVFKFTDKEVVDKVITVINSIDPEKLKAIMNAFEVDKDGWIRVKIDLGLKKE